MLAHADLAQRAPQVDDEELQHVEHPRRGVLHADHQPSLVVEADTSRGVDSHGRVEDVVVATVQPVVARRGSLRPGLVAPQRVGPGDEHRFGMRRAERVGQLQPECAGRPPAGRVGE